MQPDDAIAALMAEMGARQGYVPSSSGAKSLESSSPEPTTRDTSSQHSRLLPELEGYPDNSHKAGNQSIWNPYVAPPKTTTTTAPEKSCPSRSVHLPTNPQVEVIRRRAFEKFKQECTDVIQRMQQTWEIRLPIPAMLEKWHMDAKLAEWQEGINRTRTNKSGSMTHTQEEESLDNVQVLASTAEIYRLTTLSKSKGRKFQFWDPILPSKNAASLFQSTFEPEVKKAWTSKPQSPAAKSPSSTSVSVLPPKFSKKAGQIERALYRCICQASELFEQQLSQAVKLDQQQKQAQSAHNRKRRRLPKISRDEDSDQYKCSYAGITLKVHAAYFEKLQRLYDRAQLSMDKWCVDEFSFEEALFCLLCRYDMLQGAGLQAGVPGQVMDVLLEHLDCRMECFASPLNCRYERFASAFDLDRAFGGRGSYFDLDDEFFASGGCYQANPPFCEGVIGAMNHRIHSLLEHHTSQPLMFVVFVPAWNESAAYNEGLLKNSFLVKHLLLESGKHWYAEGTQHRRKGSFRPASFDTSILFYQNEAAARKLQLSESLLDDLKRAFCNDPGTMDKASIAPRKTNNAAVPSPKPTDGEESSRVIETIDGGQKSRPAAPGREKGKRKDEVYATKEGRKKRQWSDLTDESKSQLSLLESLGLSSDTGGAQTTSSTKAPTMKKRKGKK